MLRLLLGGILALALPFAAFAGKVKVESLKGDAMLGETRLAQGQEIVAPATISTEAGAQVFLKFDDGMQIVLGAETLLKIVDYRYTDTNVTDRAVVDLLKGSARVVTGRVARDNPKQFFFRTPQASFGVDQPSDFTIALVNPAYVTVNSGSVLASNAAGTSSLAAGTTASIGTSATAPAMLTAGQLPASAGLATSNLSLATVSAPVGGSAAGAGAVAGGVGGAAVVVPVVVVGGALAAGAAIAGSGDDEQLIPTPTHH